MNDKLISSNVVKFPKLSSRVAVMQQGIENIGVVMNAHKTGEELKQSLLGEQKGVSTTTLRDLLRACRGRSDIRLHQETLEQKEKAISDIRGFLGELDISMYYPRECDVIRGQKMHLDDQVRIYLPESKAGKVIDGVLNPGKMESRGAIQDYSDSDEMIRDAGGFLFLLMEPYYI